jgi:hypothetical protein
MAPPTGARCAKHADVAAVDVCQRCGTFVCGECVQIRSEDEFCSDCAKLLDRPPSRRPRVAFLCAILPCPLFVALVSTVPVVGLLLGLAVAVLLFAIGLTVILQERSARARGESSSKGVLYPLTWALLALDVALPPIAVTWTMLSMARHFQ